MRWLMLGFTILGFALAFIARSPGLLGLGLVLGFVGLFGMVFSMAADRVASSARPEASMLTGEDLAALRARREAAKPAAVPPRAPAANAERDRTV